MESVSFYDTVSRWGVFFQKGSGVFVRSTLRSVGRQADMILYVKELGKLKSSCLLLDLMMLSGFTLRIASQPEVCSSYFFVSFVAS